MSGWLFLYLAATPGVHVADNATLVLDLDNEVQPDLMMFLDPALGGRARIREDGFADIDRISMSYFGEPYTPRDAEIASVLFEVERWHAWLDVNQRDR